MLVGMMGAGKSAVGERVAAQLGWEWVDSDDLIERGAGMTVAGIFSAEGEAAFREAESRVINALTHRREPLVVSLGGGCVLRADNRAAIRRLGTVVWLRARASTLEARVGAGDGRPLLRGQGSLERLAAQREPLYAEVADAVLDVDDLSPDEVAHRVLALVAAATRAP